MSPFIPNVRFRKLLLPVSRESQLTVVHGQASVLLSEPRACIPASPHCSQQCRLGQKKGPGQALEWSAGHSLQLSGSSPIDAATILLKEKEQDDVRSVQWREIPEQIGWF